MWDSHADQLPIIPDARFVQISLADCDFLQGGGLGLRLWFLAQLGFRVLRDGLYTARVWGSEF